MKDKREKLLPAVWFCSTALGAGLMFALPKIFFIAGNRTEGYRSVNLGSLRALVSSAFNQGGKLCLYWENATVLTGVLLAVCVLLVYKNREKLGARRTGLLIALSLLWLGLCFVNESEKYLFAYFICVVKCALVLGIFIAVAFLCCEGVKRRLSLILLLLFFVSMAPFLIVFPYPNRVIAHSYFILSAIVLLNLDEALSALPSGFTDALPSGLACIALALCVTLGALFLRINALEALLNNHAEEAMNRGETEIEMFQIPYDYVFYDGLWARREQYYYDEYGDIKLTCIDFSDWMEKYSGWRKIKEFYIPY